MAERVDNMPHDEVLNLSDEQGSTGPDSPDVDRGLGKSADEDDDFDFQQEMGGDSEDMSPTKGPGGRGSKVVANQPFDEAVDLSDDGQSVDSSSAGAAIGGGSHGAGVSTMPLGGNGVGAIGGDEQDADEDEEEEDEEESGEEESEEGGDSDGEGEAGGYNPDDYKGLEVSGEVTELFKYITRYKPQSVDLETRLKPFVPDYIPAVGEIDAFLKIPRPDGKQDVLGLSVLDEPAATQTDPSVLELQLRATMKQSHSQPLSVSSVENAHQNGRKIEEWVRSINDLHRKKPAPTVKYTRNMPDIEQLMPSWPPAMEDAFNDIPLPPASLGVDVAAYARICCALLDIPVHQNVKESLHAMFTLYSELKGNQAYAAGDLAVTGFGATIPE